MNEAMAVIIGYLLGSTPSAYIFTRLSVGKDIRHMGGGNVGSLNVFREVGFWPATAVGVVDAGKGAAAVIIALYLLDKGSPFVMLAGLAAVTGHNWMVWLKFSGGKGMGATFGALAVLFPVYGYPFGLAIMFGIILIPFIFTRNVALSMGTGLIALPFITWLGMNSGTGTIMAVILGLVIGIKFLPTAKTAWVEAEKKEDFIFDHRRNEEER